MKLGRIDIKALRELQKKGRIANVGTGAAVDSSPSPCLMRVKKLEAEDHIMRYSAHRHRQAAAAAHRFHANHAKELPSDRPRAFSSAAADKVDAAVECRRIPPVTIIS